MSKLRNRAQKRYHERTQDPGILQFDIREWLKEPGRLVTRKELWEFVNRMEVGRRMRNRLPARLRRIGRTIWGWLTRSPLDVEDPIYRPGYPVKGDAWKRVTQGDGSASSSAASPPPGSPTRSDTQSSRPSAPPLPARPAMGSASLPTSTGVRED